MTPPTAPERIVGRFAPSPTGPLHLGSLVAAVGSYCLARSSGGLWLLRMEDLDAPRVVPGAADDILHALERFGFAWDGEVLYQSRRGERYTQAIEELQRQGRVFRCGCSRREILASAPHEGEEGPIYPGTCRTGVEKGRPFRSLRIRVPDTVVSYCDGVFGQREQCLASAVGDFVLRRADGMFAYQLAVVVDDADSGVNQVVRGEDLLGSTPRQIFLHSCFGYPVPHYIHLPLALAADGQKISKRTGAVDALSSGAGEALWNALHFLGQPVPTELRGAPAPEILRWGEVHFDLALVPRRSSIFEEGYQEEGR